MGFRIRWLFGAVVLLTSWAPAFADDVDKVLRDWSHHRLMNPQVGVHFKARAFTCDHTFQTETRSVVECWTRSIGEVRLDFIPSEPAPGEVSRRTGPNGKPYTLMPRRPERWVFTPQRMRQLFPGANPGDPPEVHDVDLSPPKRSGSWNPLEAVADHVAGQWQAFGQRGANSMMTVADIPILLEEPERKRWDVRLGRLHGVKDQIHLVLTPAAAGVSREFSQIEVLLLRDFTPFAFRSFDPAGTSETVYVYSSWLPLERDTDAFTEESIARWPLARNTAPRLEGR
ncbi:MAG TPA: hypothetical protein VM452_19465 [Caulifigura sp.]|jgi:hypothetical protein|nr:hypothetical protein [Caulifigura sp.]